MYLTKKSLLAALFLSSATFTNAAPDIVLTQIEATGSLERLIEFREAFVQWKNHHAITYDVAETEIQKMKTWVDNHGEQSLFYTIIHLNHTVIASLFSILFIDAKTSFRFSE